MSLEGKMLKQIVNLKINNFIKLHATLCILPLQNQYSWQITNPAFNNN